MLLNLNSKKSTIVDGVNTNTREETGTFEVTAAISPSEQYTMEKTAQVIERLHSMDGDRAGWITTLLEKATSLVAAATAWQEKKLEREKVALELVKLKMRGQD